MLKSNLPLKKDRVVPQETCLDVLRFWHRLEFFVPFDLDNAVSYGRETRDISFQSLLDERGDAFLPWLNNENGLFHYQLFLLPFDKKELTRMSAHFFPMELQSQQAVAMEETLDDEGLTCFARLFIDKQGMPQWDGLSISTLPWALGMMQSNEFDKLSEQRFAHDMLLLQSVLGILEDKAATLGKFDSHILLNLLKALTQWARFSPDYPFVVKIEAIPAKESQSLAEPIKSLTSKALTTETFSEELEASDGDESLDILNSFFIVDLEKSINHVAHSSHNVLEAYINGYENKIDVLATNNRELVLKHLLPQCNNLGRWPSSSHHMMSLMQQFFINQCIRPDPLQYIYATNGPPGTGKTTLLKDIIADNIVNRAKQLASFDSVASCFSGWKKIIIGDKETSIGIPQASLTGFEMLVVSSNNAAVENITLELPLKNALADEFKTTSDYLRPIATKLASKVYRQRIVPVTEAQQPWGLIAVALGNASNRQAFVERFFFAPENKEQAAERVKKGDCLTIWEWRDQYKGLSFQQAKVRFQQALSVVKQYGEALQAFANLHHKITQEEPQKNLNKHVELVSQCQNELNKLHEEHSRIATVLKETTEHQQALYCDIEQQLKFKPSLWKRLFRSQEAKLFNELISNLKTRRLELSQSILTYQSQIAKLTKAINASQNDFKKAEEVLNTLKKQYQEDKETYLRMKNDFPDINVPGDHITDHDHQMGYWQSAQYNTLRSELFTHALRLHQAWLAEALQKKYFGGNLYALNALLDGKHPTTSSDELSIWQSLFLVVPVVSSTFASISRQFKNLGSQSLGWLLIDEAGQAIPQAAVGAMWRCKKAVIVGDPRQIEPIMPLPPHLIEGVAQRHLKETNPYWLPHATSIQKLADLACVYGSVMQQEHQHEWIGVPLLVHRRCLEPMFSIANDIAYENKMINARKLSQNHSHSIPESAWFDVTGRATDKQYVPEHGACLLELFIWFYNQEQGLPRLFVITPFKRIRKNLKDLIQNQDNWRHKTDTQIPPPTSVALLKWLNAHIGTVHTFQGKENEKVIFVLGADDTQKGAVTWASSKPNLLNVALTRARDRIYIIGEWDIWAQRGYFSKASAALTRIKEQAFFNHLKTKETADI